MPRRPVAARRRPSQARRMRRLETDHVGGRMVIGHSVAWVAVNGQRLPGLALAIGCLLILAFLFSDPRFYVYEAQITGCRLLPAQEIYAASGVDMVSIFFVSSRTVRDRLLERFPGLQKVEVSLMLPARVGIRVAERQIRFVWRAGGQDYLADERGTVLGVGVAPADVFVIRSAEDAVPAQLDEGVLATVVGLSQLLGGERSFDYSSRFGISWRSERGWLVHFGVGGDLAEKVAVMRSMLAQLAQEGVTPQFLDVGVPSRPYYR